MTAQPAVLPVLYSQRYDYYDTVELRVMGRVGSAARVLDFGCGAGILTTFYAHQFPDQEFVGLDRSAVSLAVAQQKARELGLANVRFDCVDAETERLSGRQASFEQRTGLGVRLDQLSTVLDQDGRMIVCEKTRQLARRVPFQRALAERGLQLVEPPELIRYQSVEEVTDDGPLYHRQKGARFCWIGTTQQILMTAHRATLPICEGSLAIPMLRCTKITNHPRRPLGNGSTNAGSFKKQLVRSRMAASCISNSADPKAWCPYIAPIRSTNGSWSLLNRLEQPCSTPIIKQSLRVWHEWS